MQSSSIQRVARSPARSPGVAPFLYNAALTVGSPFLLAYLGYRLVWKGKSRAGLGQRFGAVPRLGPPPAAGRLWLHAVSAGEMVAAAPIVRHLQREAPEAEVIVSSTTPAGYAQAKRLIPGARAWFYFPFDFYPCVEAALARAQPTVVATVETEIWPNWLSAIRRRGARAALLNGKFTDRGFRRAAKFRPLYRWALSQFEHLLMQTQTDAGRAVSLGAPPERVRVAGNSKFEQEVPVMDPARRAAFRREVGLEPGRPLWIAGSTHPGEEDAVLEAFAAARARVPDLALLLAPRHIERSDEVAARIERGAWKYRRRTDPSGPGRPDVVLLNTMGELAAAYAVGDVVFVGGSLAPVGGHDILQPLLQEKPTLFGPHMHNQREIAALALEAGAALPVEDAESLAAAVTSCLLDAGRAASLSSAGSELLARHRGAARAGAELLRDLLQGGA